jgi:PIN domain nuclease of toxin-antitoxin system
MPVPPRPRSESLPLLHDDPSTDLLVDTERDEPVTTTTDDASRWRYASALHAARTLTARSRH